MGTFPVPGAYFHISTIRARIYSTFTVAAANAIKRLRKRTPKPKTKNSILRTFIAPGGPECSGWNRSLHYHPSNFQSKLVFLPFLHTGLSEVEGGTRTVTTGEVILN